MSGKGLEPEKLFEPGYTTKKEQGHGMGSMLSNLVRDLQGKVWCSHERTVMLSFMWYYRKQEHTERNGVWGVLRWTILFITLCFNIISW